MNTFILHDCLLQFHDPLFYETRTLGRLYETGRLLHNIALSYALGLGVTTYHHHDYVPRYAEELDALNERGIYVTPAIDVDIHFVVHTFKFGDERSNIYMEKSNKNIPTFGRAKEIGVGSTFRFGVLAPEKLSLPRWIRMGIWMSKAQLNLMNTVEMRRVNKGLREEVVTYYPINPGDLPDTVKVRTFDLISMRPTNLLQNVEIEADDWWVATLEYNENRQTVYLPYGLRYNLRDQK